MAFALSAGGPAMAFFDGSHPTDLNARVVRTAPADGSVRAGEASSIAPVGNSFWNRAAALAALAALACYARLRFGGKRAAAKNAERTPKEREDTLKSLLDATSDVCLLLDPDGKIIFSNKAAAAALAVANTDIVGQNVFDVMPGERAAQRIKKLREAVETGTTLRYTDVSTPGRVYETGVFPVTGDDGRIRAVAVFAKDVSEREIVHRELHDTLRKLRKFEAMVNRSPAVVVLWKNAPDWPVEFVAENITQFGYRPDDFTSGRVPFMSIVHPSDLAELEADIRRHLDARDDEYTQEYRMKTAAGEYRWIEDRTEVIRDKNGQITHFQGIILDITERRNAQREVDALRQQIEFVLGATGTGLDVIDADFNIRYIDPEWRKVYGDPTGVKCYKYFMGRDTVCPGCGVVLALERGETVVSEETLPLENDRPVQVISKPFKTPDGEWLVAEINVDIGETKRREQECRQLEKRLRQSQKMEAIGHLAGGVAHNFNNILNSVIGFADIVVSETTDPKSAEHAARIKKAGQRAADLARQLLAFSRQSMYKLVRVDVNEILKEVLALLGETVDPAIRIECVFAPSGLYTRGDASQLMQVFLNLALNARDAMPDGGVMSFTTALAGPPDEMADDREQCILVTVADTGVGIDEQNITKIFDPFFTTKEVGKGVGLGLSSAYGCIEHHKGVMKVESTPGKGTKFSVYLPVFDGGAALRHESSARVVTATGGANVMIIDDEEDIRELAIVSLRKSGFNVRAFRSGAAALAYLGKNADKVDVVLLDISMPEMDGPECLEKILSKKPDARVIVISGHGKNALAKNLLENGAKAYVQKPWERKKLIETVNAVLDGDKRKTEG